MTQRLKSPKWFVLGALGLGCLALALAAAWVALFGAGLDPKVEALRAAGEPVCLADLARPPIPPEDNAFVYLRRAKGEISAIDTEINVTAYSKLTQPEQEAFDQGELGPEMIAVMREAWALHPGLFENLEQAANCPDYDPGRDFSGSAEGFINTPLDDVQALRGAFRALSARAAVQVADGRSDDALHTCVVGLRLVRLFDQRPLYIDHLVAIACLGVTAADTQHVLRNGPVSAASTREVEAELARIDLFELFRQSLRCERAFELQHFREIGGHPGQRFALLFSADRNYESILLEAVQRAITASRLPPWEWKGHVDLSFPSDRIGPMTEGAVNSIEAVHNATMRSEAVLRALRVFNAIKQREQVGELAEPIELDQLGLPADATTDPFDGNPLRLKKLPTGWAVYSIGQNLIDDGGVEADSPNDGDIGAGLEPPASTASATASGEETAPEE